MNILDSNLIVTGIGKNFDDTQNYPFWRLKLLVENVLTLISVSQQIKIHLKVLNVFKLTNKSTLGTIEIKVQCLILP